MRQEVVVWGGEAYVYTLRRSRRARQVLLTVDEAAAVELVVPQRVSLRAARQFLQERRAWLSRAVVRARAERRVVPSLVSGARIACFGQAVRLQVVCEPGRRRRRWRETAGVLQVHVRTMAEVRAVVRCWYKRRAAVYFLERVAGFAARLGVSPGRVVVSEARTQWGSCIQSTGRISLSWRLALAPLPVADYVAAHEVAHLRERRHTPRFRAMLAELVPECAMQERWLRRHGRGLVL